MKSILLSIRPEWVAKILNGEKTIEIRKKFPKDYVGWVYIYCTKSNNKLIKGKDKFEIFNFTNDMVMKDHNTGKELNIDDFSGNSKVVARFWCDKVEEIRFDLDNTYFENFYYMSSMNEPTLCRKSCLTKAKLNNYLGVKNGYAIHISKLEIFDKPKELSEFYYKRCNFGICHFCSYHTCDGGYKVPITKAPQNYCYIEELNNDK